MKKKTKLFKHFITILNILACSVPLLAFAIVTLQDVLPKYFTSLGMQHHGDGSSTFDDDLNALTDSNQFKDMNYHMLNTLDRLDYFNYDLIGKKIVEVPTNEVNTLNDLHVGSYYHFSIDNTSIDKIFSLSNFDMLIELYNVTFYDFTNYTFEYADNIAQYSSLFIGSPTILLSITSSYTEFSFYMNDNMDYFYVISCDALSEYSFSLNCDIKIIDINFVYDYFGFNAFTSTQFYQIQDVEGYDNFDDFIDYQNNRSYTDIIQDTDTHLPLNIDFISLFTQSEIINRNGNVAIYLFINYYMNYLINILIILFLPELTIIFFFMLKNLTYKLIDKEF